MCSEQGTGTCERRHRGKNNYIPRTGGRWSLAHLQLLHDYDRVFSNCRTRSEYSHFVFVADSPFLCCSLNLPTIRVSAPEGAQFYFRLERLAPPEGRWTPVASSREWSANDKERLRRGLQNLETNVDYLTKQDPFYAISQYVMDGMFSPKEVGKAIHLINVGHPDWTIDVVLPAGLADRAEAAVAAADAEADDADDAAAHDDNDAMVCLHSCQADGLFVRMCDRAGHWCSSYAALPLGALCATCFSASQSGCACRLCCCWTSACSATAWPVPQTCWRSATCRCELCGVCVWVECCERSELNVAAIVG